MDQIVEGVKAEFGMDDLPRLDNLKMRCQARFTRTHPEFDSNGPGVLKLKTLDAEAKRRRQRLLNEVTERYVRQKEAHPHKLADGTLERIIEAAKADLGITEFEVKKDTIRGRLNRNSFYVRTLGNHSPYDVLDAKLVETINGWLGQGLSVTRAQGLELANRLLKEHQGQKKDGDDAEDKEGGGAEEEFIALSAPWWRNFLERNRKKLVCADELDEK